MYYAFMNLLVLSPQKRCSYQLDPICDLSVKDSSSFLGHTMRELPYDI